MRKEITCKVPYRDEGDDKEIKIKIDFVSQRTMKNYSDLVQLAGIAEDSHNRMSDLNTLIAAEQAEKKEGHKERIDEYLKELKEQYDQILEFNDNGYFEKRYKILERLLIDNGHKENEMIMDVNFWDEKVDPADLIVFMTEAIYKDTSKKKV